MLIRLGVVYGCFYGPQGLKFVWSCPLQKKFAEPSLNTLEIWNFRLPSHSDHVSFLKESNWKNKTNQFSGFCPAEVQATGSQLLEGTLRRWTRAVCSRTTEGLCVGCLASLTGPLGRWACRLCLWLPLPEATCFHTQGGTPLVTGRFLGPGDTGMASPRASEEGFSVEQALQPLQRTTDCVLFPSPQGAIRDCPPHPARFWAPRLPASPKRPGRSADLQSWRQIPM